MEKISDEGLGERVPISESKKRGFIKEEFFPSRGSQKGAPRGRFQWRGSKSKERASKRGLLGEGFNEEALGSWRRFQGDIKGREFRGGSSS